VQEVVLADGEPIPADLVIVGVGVVPNTELASAAGLSVDNGIVIDDQARTSDPDIVAAGDCTSHTMARYGSRIRWNPYRAPASRPRSLRRQSAENTAQSLRFRGSGPTSTISNQIAGLNAGYDEVLLSGDPSRERDFSCFYFREGELIAADCVNRPRDFMSSKRAISQQLRLTCSEPRRLDLTGELDGYKLWTTPGT
jgi:3-phenylpropionate/trans-cinnamate dioxygenase ferredoxin reductase subunit